MANRRRAVSLRLFIGAVIFCSALAIGSSTAATASASPHSSSPAIGARPLTGTSTWTPTDAPLPASLPSGLAPQLMALYATSCSSSAFCLSVGTVGDAHGNGFPLVETYSNGKWTASVAPTPANASSDAWGGDLKSVSCSANGKCAAVGVYDSKYGSAALPSALLDNLSGGSWSTTEGAVPADIGDGSVNGERAINVESVSCPSTTFCSAVGVGNGGNPSFGLLWDWSQAGWRLSGFLLTSMYVNATYLSVASISCVDEHNCVAVGSYSPTGNTLYALILRWDDGVWVLRKAPVPTNAIKPNRPNSQAFLSSIDCPQVDFCVAGGQYNTTSLTSRPLLDVWASGRWTAVEGPMPSGVRDSVANIESLSCPAQGACTGVGEYGGIDGYSGMSLSLLNGSWSAAHAPYLAGIGCSVEGFCASAGLGVFNPLGGVSRHNLLEVGLLNRIPYISTVSPHSGGAGTAVTMTGASFTPNMSVRFGNTASSHVAFASSDKIEVSVPQGVACGVDVSVTANGLTSGSSTVAWFRGSFCQRPKSPTIVSARAGDASGSVSFSPPTNDGGGPITGYSVTAYDEYNTINGGETAIGTSSPITINGLTNGDTYRFEVRATNSVGTGPASMISNAVVARP